MQSECFRRSEAANKLSKVAIFALTCLLLIGFNVSVVAADIVAEYPYPAWTTGYEAASCIYDDHPATGGVKSGVFQVFRVSYNETLLLNITVLGKRVGNPSAFFRMGLYSCSGVVPNAVPNSLIELSTTDWQVSSMVVSTMSLVTFVFSGETTLYTDTDYAWFLYCYNYTTLSTSNYMGVYYDGTDVSGDVTSYYGNAGIYSSSAFSVVAVNDFPFVVQGNGGVYAEYVDIGGVTINNFYDVTNTTVEANVTADVTVEFNNTAVSATGGVTVDEVNANFNNTAVTAEAANATINEITLNATITDGEFTIEGGIEVDYTYLIGLLAILGIGFLIMKWGFPAIGITWGIFTIAICASLAGNETVPFYPYLTLATAILGLFFILYAGNKWRNG